MRFPGVRTGPSSPPGTRQRSSDHRFASRLEARRGVGASPSTLFCRLVRVETPTGQISLPSHLNDREDAVGRLRKRYVDGRWGQVHLRVTEPEHPSARPIVCLHQSPLSSRSYETFMREMAGDRRVFAIDTPGYGESDPPPAPIASIAEYAAGHGEVVDALGLGEIDIVGTHTGARMAVELALQRPKQVRHLVLVGCSCYSDEERERQRSWNEASFKATEGSNGEHLVTTWKNWSQFRWEGVSDAMIERYVSDSIRDRSRATWALQAVFAHDMSARVRLVDQPVLIFNVRDDIYEATKRAGPLLKRGRVVDMSPAGLWLLEVKTAEVARMVREFLAQP
ncbi:MAG: alpha/beta hydrolase [Alphaproteobacteria bacterium]|nr:alpha/beta hydrolase [Alphaproteobacteria bacterium]